MPNKPLQLYVARSLDRKATRWFEHSTDCRIYAREQGQMAFRIWLKPEIIIYLLNNSEIFSHLKNVDEYIINEKPL